MRKPVLLLSAAALLGAAQLPAAAQAPVVTVATPPPAPTPAAWKAVDYTLSYQGFTSKYSCSGLRETVRDVLLQLGARGDLTLYDSGCPGPDRVSRTPVVQIHMFVLQPAPGTPPPGALATQWTPVTLTGFGKLQPGDCELIQQIKEELLPLFAARDVVARTGCVPHQLPTSVLLQAVVLKVVDTTKPTQ